MPRIFMCIKLENTEKLQAILAETPQIPPMCQWVTFLRNHDELTLEMVTPEERQYMWKQYAPDPRMRLNVGIRRRLAPLLDNDRRKIELAYNMLLTLPGSPILYYGDEICMGDNIWLFDRNGVRTPMQWDSTLPHAGFSTAARTYAPVITGEYGPERVNVQDAMADPASLYNILSCMLARRREHPAFGFGSIEWINQPEPAVACYMRYHGIDHVLVVSNTSKLPKQVTVPIPRRHVPAASEHAEDLLRGVRVPFLPTPAGPVIELMLRPYEFMWLALREY